MLAGVIGFRGGIKIYNKRNFKPKKNIVKRLLITTLSILAAVSFGPFNTSADPIPFVISTGNYPSPIDEDGLRDGWTGTLQSGLTYAGTMGFSFTVGSQNIEVSALGYYDGPNSDAANVAGYTPDGLLNAHQVGIFDSAGNIVSGLDVTVPSGTSGTVVGEYRYVTLTTPVILEAGESYTIGGQVTTTDLTTSGDVFRDNSGGSFTVSSLDVAVAANNLAYSGPPENPNFADGVFQAPNAISDGYGAGNFLYSVVAVPEPSTYALMGIGLGLLFVMQRHHRSVR